MASNMENQAVNTACVFSKLPAEVRKMIFIQAAHNFFDEQPKRQVLLYDPYRGLSLNDTWMELLNSDKFPWRKELEAKSIPSLERALVGDRSLFIECLGARLSVSTLMMVESVTDPEQGEINYSVLGQDIPFRALASIRHIRYFVCFAFARHREDVDQWCARKEDALKRSLEILAKNRKKLHPKLVLEVKVRYRHERAMEDLREAAHRCEEQCKDILGFINASSPVLAEPDPILVEPDPFEITSRVFVEQERQLTQIEKEMLED